MGMKFLLQEFIVPVLLLSSLRVKEGVGCFCAKHDVMKAYIGFGGKAQYVLDLCIRHRLKSIHFVFVSL
jgi:hypothetical protein